MKVDSRLTVIKGAQEQVSRRSPRPRPSSCSPEGVIILISRENRRAWQSIPASHQEALRVLQEVQGRLQQDRKSALAKVHRLDAWCLVRLR